MGDFKAELPSSDAPPSDAASVLFLMVVGPGEGTLATDTLESIATCEPLATTWVLDDCTTDGTYETLVKWAAVHPGTRVLRNPARRGYRGIAKSFFSLLQAVADHPHPPDFVIKVDPDTCLVEPGIVDLMRARFLAAGAGIVGAYRIGANGGRRTFDRPRRNLLLDLLPVGLHKDRRSVRIGLPFWASYLRAARRHGYAMGEHVLGALSGIHADTLRALRASGFLNALPDRYRALTVEEDILLGLATKAVGHQLIDITTDPAYSRVWIQFRPPVPYGAQALLDRKMLAVHPLKATPDGEEMRAAFRRHRRGLLTV